MIRRAVLTICVLPILASAQTAAPVISSGGVLNAADGSAQLAPGVLFSIYGRNLAAASATAPRIPLPDTLGGVTVEVASGGATRVAPIWFISPGQINAQLPFGLAAGTVQVRVKTAAGSSAYENATVVPGAPRFFTKDMSGRGEAIAFHANYTLVSLHSPAVAGETVIMYLTGLGEVSPAAVAGQGGGDGSPAAPLNRVVRSVSVSIGGAPAQVAFAGLAPYFVGVYQLNVRAPGGALGNQVLVATVDGRDSQASVTMAAGSIPIATAVIGPAGGTLAAPGISMAVAAGAIATTESLSILFGGCEQATAMGRDLASGVYQIGGLPDGISAPITVTLDLNRAIEGETYLVVQDDSPQAGGPLLIPGTVSGSKFTAVIPATLTAVPKSNSPAAAIPVPAAVTSVPTFWAITGYYAILSSTNRFRITYPAHDLIEGGAEKLADALDSAYVKLDGLGVDWRLRTRWPIAVSIEPLAGSNASKWASVTAGFGVTVQSQYITVNSNRMSDIETMKIAVGHELFHVIQNLYDPRFGLVSKWVDGPWIWNDEAASTWFERLLSPDPNYLPCTVVPTCSTEGSDNYAFMTQHGLEFPPSEGNAQEHGYGASQFMQYLSTRYGDAFIGRMVAMKTTRGPGLTGASLYSPVDALDNLTLGIGVQWRQFLENYMAGSLWKRQFPTPTLIDGLATGANKRIFASENDAPAVFSWDAPDLSGRAVATGFQYQPAATAKISIRLDAPAGLAEAIVYLASGSSWQRLHVINAGETYDITNAGQQIKLGDRLTIMVANGRAVKPYNGTSPVSLTISPGGLTLQQAIQQQTKLLLLNVNADIRIATASGTSTLISVSEAVPPENATCPLPVWNFPAFTISGTCTVPNLAIYNVKIDGQLDPTAKTLLTLNVESTKNWVGGGGTYSVKFSMRNLPMVANTANGEIVLYFAFIFSDYPNTTDVRATITSFTYHSPGTDMSLVSVTNYIGSQVVFRNN